MASFPSTHPASVAASALNFPLLGGPLCLVSYWPLKLTFKLQEGCTSHHMLVFSSDRKWAERGGDLEVERGSRKLREVVGIYTIVRIRSVS